MKILIIASPWLGGSGTVAFRIAKKLAEDEANDIHFLSYELPYKASLADGIRYHTLEDFSYPLFPFKLNEFALVEQIVELCIQEKIEIVHSHYAILFGHATVMAKKILNSKGHNISTVSTLHGSDVIGFDLTNPGKIAPKHLTAFTVNESDITTVASKTLKKILLDVYDIEKKVNIVPNFIDLEKYQDTSRQKKQNKIIHMSNFRPVKQPIIVAKVFEKVVKNIPNAQLVLVGDGPMRKDVIEYLNSRGIANFKLHGKIRNEKKLISILSEAKVLLLPSLFENFPLVALEAHACGIPVVGSNEGGIPELVINGETGFITEKDAIDIMARHTSEILNNDALLEKLGANARLRIGEYETNTIISKYIKLYKKELRKNKLNSNKIEYQKSYLRKYQ